VDVGNPNRAAALLERTLGDLAAAQDWALSQPWPFRQGKAGETYAQNSEVPRQNRRWVSPESNMTLARAQRS
jgi:hypothetical protein